MEKRKLKILLIDDDLSNTTVFKKNIIKALPGTVVLTALDGLKGLKLAKKHEPDVILIDVSISKADGLKISQIIKKDKNLQTTPMLFITDLEGDNEFRQNLLKSGPDAFLIKPIDDLLLITQLKAMAKIKERNMLIITHKERLETIIEERTKDLKNEINERKKLEKELRISENLFRTYIKKAPIGIFVTNALGQYIEANETACKMMGRTKKEVLHLSIADYLVPNELEKGLADFQILLEKEFLSTEYRVRRKNDQDYWISLLASKINDNCILAFCTDITERKLKDKKLKLLSDNLLDLTNELAEKNEALSSMLEQIIEVLSKIGEMKDGYTAGHQKRVGLLSCAIAREMKLSNEVIHNLSIGALLHDIGKINIPTDILNKPGKLSELEYQIIQCHADNSYEIVKGIDFPKQVISMIHQHHERLDGSGYPQGLLGKKIILESRILAVSDVVEAMSSHRPYRPALGVEAGLEEILMYKGTKFDSDVVDACVKVFREHGFTFSE